MADANATEMRESKKCASCENEKGLGFFSKQAHKKDGLSVYCKPCDRARARTWRLANIDASHSYGKKWRENNKTSVSAKGRRWRTANQERCAELVWKWRERNPEARKASYKRENDRRRALPHFRIEKAMREGMRLSLRGGKAGRSWERLAGYTFLTLKAHIERQFQTGMTWDNYGQWHIDHIVPLALLRYVSAECQDFKAAWSLANLRPLWAADNCKKQAKRTHLL